VELEASVTPSLELVPVSTTTLESSVNSHLERRCVRKTLIAMTVTTVPLTSVISLLPMAHASTAPFSVPTTTTAPPILVIRLKDVSSSIRPIAMIIMDVQMTFVILALENATIPTEAVPIWIMFVSLATVTLQHQSMLNASINPFLAKNEIIAVLPIVF